MTEDELRRRGEEDQKPPKVGSPNPVTLPARSKEKVIAN
jgi:hypothetical protein